MPILIRQATEDDKDKIFSFIREAFPKEGKYMAPQRWEWLFENNPFRRNGELAVWIALNDDSIVGQIGALPVNLKVNNNIYPANWGVDLMVLPQYRGIGLGIRLLKAKSASNVITLGGQMSDEVKKIRLYIGNEVGNPACVYSKVTPLSQKIPSHSFSGDRTKHDFIERDLFGATGIRKLQRLITWLLNRRLLQRSIRRDPTLNTQYVFKEISSFDQAVNKLWNDLSHQFNAAVVRNMDYLNWKFTDQPNLKYNKFYMYCENALIGYLVLRRTEEVEGDHGIIVDYLVDFHEEEQIQLLFQYAEYCLLKSFSNGIMCAASLPQVKETLHRNGYSVIRRIYPTISINDEKLDPVKTALIREFHLTFGDQDWDQYRPWQRQDI